MKPDSCNFSRHHHQLEGLDPLSRTQGSNVQISSVVCKCQLKARWKGASAPSYRSDKRCVLNSLFGFVLRVVNMRWWKHKVCFWTLFSYVGLSINVLACLFMDWNCCIDCSWLAIPYVPQRNEHYICSLTLYVVWCNINFVAFRFFYGLYPRVKCACAWIAVVCTQWALRNV